MNSLNPLQPSLPALQALAGVGAALRHTANGAAGAGEGALLRAEVEPAARGLSVQAHAERVLAALQAEPAVRRNT